MTFGGSGIHLDSLGTHLWHSSSLNVAREVIAYLDRFPLRGEKLDSPLKWREGVSIPIAKGHRTEEGWQGLRSLKSGMNGSTPPLTDSDGGDGNPDSSGKG